MEMFLFSHGPLQFVPRKFSWPYHVSIVAIYYGDTLWLICSFTLILFGDTPGNTGELYEGDDRNLVKEWAIELLPHNNERAFIFISL